MYLFNSKEDVTRILNQIGNRLARPAEAVLYGGCAIMLMGRRGRDTDDFDLDCREDRQLLELVQQVTQESGVVADLTYNVEAFIAVSTDLLEPHARYGQFGLLTVYLCDPAIIATSKLDRRNLKDLEDIQWLLSTGLLSKERFQACVEACHEYDDRRKALETMRNLLGLTEDQPATPNKPAQRRSRWWLWMLLVVALLVVLVWAITA